VPLYFARERAYLARSKELKIERLVDTRILASPDVRTGLLALLRDHPTRLTASETDCPWFECFLCQYARAGESHLKALFVINDVRSHSPALGLYVDSRAGPTQKSVAYAIDAWYENRVVRGRALDELIANSPVPPGGHSRLRRYVTRIFTAWVVETCRIAWEHMSSAGTRLVALVVGLLVLALAANFLSNASDVSLWAIQAGLLALIFYVVARTYLLLHRPAPPAQVVSGEAALRRQYVEMRHTPGATSIQAIWSAKYVDAATYFRREREELQNDQQLTIDRLIDGAVLVIPEVRAALGELAARPSNLRVAGTTCPEFECFLCHYDHGSEQRSKALFVINDVYENTPELGLYFDPEEAQLSQVRPVTHTLGVWFESGVEHRRLGEGITGANRAMPATGAPAVQPTVLPTLANSPVSQHDWNISALSYDEEVTESELDFLQGFMAGEYESLRDLAGSGEFAAQTGLTIIEVGSGTGRTLFALATKAAGVGRLPELLIGIDSSTEMLRVAEAKRQVLMRQASGGLLGRLAFISLDATSLTDVFLNGGIREEDGGRVLGDAVSTGLLDVARFGSSQKVFCSLLNTLGVLDNVSRARSVREMAHAAGPDDLLVVSVFNAECFLDMAPSLYRSLPNTVGSPDIPDGAFDFTTSTFDHVDRPTGTRYTSHWFSEIEICTLLEREGIAVSGVTPIGECGHFVVGKRRHP
jgi:SAM-dependent methyltransferase